MSVRLEAYNLTHDEAKAHLLDVLASNLCYYGGVRVRCVAARYGSEWRNTLCIVHVFPKEVMPAKQESQHFSDLHLLEMWLRLDQYRVFLEKMPEGSLPWGTSLGIDHCRVHFGRANRLTRWRFHSNSNPYFDYPGYLYETGQDDPIALPSGPLIDPVTGNFYSGVDDAIGTWSELKDYNPHFDGRCCSMMHFVPECRSRMQSIQRSDASLELAVHTADGLPLDLWLIGEVRFDDRKESIHQPVHGASKIEIDIREANAVELYLVDRRLNPYDCYRDDFRAAYDDPWRHSLSMEVAGGLQIQMADKVEVNQYNVGQAGAVGPSAHAEQMTFQQIGSPVGSHIDARQLANELTLLLQRMYEESNVAEDQEEVAAVVVAEEAAREGKLDTALGALKRLGKPVLYTAEKIGLPLLVDVLKKHYGLG